MSCCTEQNLSPDIQSSKKHLLMHAGCLCKEATANNTDNSTVEIRFSEKMLEKYPKNLRIIFKGNKV